MMQTKGLLSGTNGLYWIVAAALLSFLSASTDARIHYQINRAILLKNILRGNCLVKNSVSLWTEKTSPITCQVRRG